MSSRSTLLFVMLICADALISSPTLHAEQIQFPDGRIFLPPPPADSSHAQAADIQAYEKSRILKNSNRWQLAQNDADLRPEHIIDDFSCAVGFRILPNEVPTLVSVLSIIEKPLEQRISEEKENWQRKRPFVGKNQSICTPDANKLSASFSYPSGHTTWGWLVASILSSALPDRSTYIMQRGRVFGESRIVCGVHWKSDVQAGYMNGGAMFAALQEQPWFAEKIKNIRKELQEARLKAMPLNNATCSIEHEAAKETF
ncbi:MAG: phosphatase PAP2 family protein [Acetobacter okinawensis]|uniref:acid phosphatase n=1 Tax=Acetobacter okinawensis TaxID=1076594 RepID=UPI0039EBA150